MNKETENIMVIAGEISGDLHGASLITELKKIDPRINVYGIGGDRMQAAGMILNCHINRMAFLGFVEVVKHIPFIKKLQKQLMDIVKEKNIRTVVLIDYPGFNLSFAKMLKKEGIKIVYYISPQIWAWGAGRINKIKSLVDKILVILPFEEQLYRDHNVPVEFVGHPLLERMNEQKLLTRDELNSRYGLDKDKGILLILAGSRKHEVDKIFPEAAKAAEKLAGEFNLQVVAACSSNIDENVFYSLSGSKSFKVIRNQTYDLMNAAKFGIIKSGTSTLEAALFELPMVIVYKTSMLTYQIGKRLVKVKNIGLANIVAGETVVPELIQHEASAAGIYRSSRKILADEKLYNSLKERLRSIKSKLGERGASSKAAASVYAVMKEA